MSTESILHGSYRRRIGEPTTGDEVTGYWLFALGLLVGAAGIFGFLLSAPNSMLRQTGIAFAAFGLVLLMIGPIVRLPLRTGATTVAYVGAAVCVTAIGWFMYAFPGSWRIGDPAYFQEIIALYSVGIGLIGFGAVLVPLLVPGTPEEVLHAESATDAANTATDAARADAARAEAETANAEAEAARAEADTARADADAARADADAARADAETATGDTESALAAGAAATEQLDSMLESDAWFEVFEDTAGEFRWRLRHRDGEIIASSGDGFETREEAETELQNVARNAGGAAVHQRTEAVDAEETAVEPVDVVPESQASFDVYEDDEGGWRWRLVHENGNIIADSGEGYASKRNARDGMNRVRGYADQSSSVDPTSTTFEIYEDDGNEWRWRLVHRNGNVLADSGEGYHNRSNASRAVDGVRRHATDAGLDA